MRNSVKKNTRPAVGRERSPPLKAPKPRGAPKGRLRGGASHLCPICGGQSSVVVTMRDNHGNVTRQRACHSDKTHKFVTKEVVV